MINQSRREYVRGAGIVFVKKSGAVCVNWKKAVKSKLFRDEMRAMRRIERA